MKKKAVRAITGLLCAAMAYLGILVVAPFFMEGKTQFVRYHLGQGAALFAVEILYSIMYQLLAVTVLMVSWRLYLIVRIAGYEAVSEPDTAIYSGRDQAGAYLEKGRSLE